jgi:hypothetical protein
MKTSMALQTIKIDKKVGNFNGAYTVNRGREEKHDEVDEGEKIATDSRRDES